MEQQDTDNGELISFGIVASAGQARSLAFEALAAARKHDFDKADELLAAAEQAGLEAHKMQTQLLANEADGKHTEVNVLLVHAQDHLMTAMLARELIAELVYLHKEKADKASDTDKEE